MLQGSFGPATIESGANKGKPRTLTYKTGIKAENANGLPLDSDKKFALVEVNQATIPVTLFENADEVRSYAGAHFDTFVVSAANERMKRAVTSKLQALFKKAKVAAADWKGVITTALASITPEGIFTPSEGVSGKVAKATLVDIYNNGSLSAEEKLAAIMALAK